MEQYYTMAELELFSRKEKLTTREALHKFLKQGLLPAQFKRNGRLLTPEEQLKLFDLPIFIAGCGGLGGEVSSHLVRLGAGNLILCDFDSFDESNLNRQRFCDLESLHHIKAAITAHALNKISPWGNFEPFVYKLTENDQPSSLISCAIIIDCLDSVRDKKLLEQMAKKNDCAWLYGSVLHHEGFACLKSCGEAVLSQLYMDDTQSGAGAVLAHVVAGTAALMISLFIKWLKNPEYNSPLLHVDFSIPELEKFRF